MRHFFLHVGARNNRNDVYFRFNSRSFSRFLLLTCKKAKHYSIRSFSFQPTDCFNHDVRDIHCRYDAQYSSLSPFERKLHDRSVSSKLLRRRRLSHHSQSDIKYYVSTQTDASFHPALSALTTKTKTQKNMLVCQQTPSLITNDVADNDYSSTFFTISQLAAMITNISKAKLIIDCGLPLRYTERRILDSFLLNVNDKISRKRLATRGLKAFLDADQLSRLNNNNCIVLYDDTTRALPCSSCSSVQSQLSPAMKCIYDEIKRFDSTKNIYILQTSFNDFYQHYQSLCYTSPPMNQDESAPESPPTPIEVDIDMCPMSEVLPGLFLGNSRDAQNLDLLRQHQIQIVINASTSIPCHFEEENIFEYHRLACQDSINQDILQFFESTFKFIHENLSKNRNIFIHCQAGISRSPSFVIGYLMKHHSKMLDDAYNLVKSRRSIIGPNLNFLGQLTQYQQMLITA